MIPDFKTYLKESVWMDIHRRSNGDQERKEENLNYMDCNDLYNYILQNYETVKRKTANSIYIYNGRLYVSIYHDSYRTIPDVEMGLSFNPIDFCIFTSGDQYDDPVKELYKKLFEGFEYGKQLSALCGHFCRESRHPVP